jgi:hypothetical protein
MPNTTPPTAANEQGVVHVQGFVRISDPETKEVIVEQRA